MISRIVFICVLIFYAPATGIIIHISWMNRVGADSSVFGPPLCKIMPFIYDMIHVQPIIFLFSCNVQTPRHVPVAFVINWNEVVQNQILISITRFSIHYLFDNNLESYLRPTNSFYDAYHSLSSIPKQIECKYNFYDFKDVVHIFKNLLFGITVTKFSQHLLYFVQVVACKMIDASHKL